MADSVIEMLQNTPVWSGLTSQDLGMVAKYSEERKIESGQTIVKKGAPGDGFYLLLDGAVEVRSGGDILSKLGPGQFFGEMAIFEEQPRSADVITVEPSRVLFLSANAFKTLLFANPRIGLKMLQERSKRLRNTTQRLTD